MNSKQYKWYKIDLKNSENTFINLEKKLSSRIKKLNNTNFLLEYDYSGNFAYKNLLEFMNGYKTSQKIITTNGFYSFLKQSLKIDDIKISEIKFLECLQEESKFIKTYIKEVNKTKSDEKINELIEELQWLKSDGIDIQYIEFNDFSESLIYKFQIFSNGVVLVDDEKILNKVMNFLEGSI